LFTAFWPDFVHFTFRKLTFSEPERRRLQLLRLSQVFRYYMLGAPRSGLRRRVSTASDSEQSLRQRPFATARGTDPVDAL